MEDKSYLYIIKQTNTNIMTTLKISTMDGRRFMVYAKTYSEAIKEAEQIARGSVIWKVEEK